MPAAGQAGSCRPGGAARPGHDIEDGQARGPRPRRPSPIRPARPGVGDQRARRGLLDQPGQLGRGAGRVGGTVDRAERGQGQPAEQVLRGGPGGQHDQVAAADAFPARSAARQPPGPRRRRTSARRGDHRSGARCRPGPGWPRWPADRDRAGPGPAVMRGGRRKCRGRRRHRRRHHGRRPWARPGRAWRAAGRAPARSSGRRTRRRAPGRRLVHSAHRIPTKLPRPV